MHEQIQPLIPESRPQRYHLFWWLAPKPFDWVSSSLYVGILVVSYLKLGIRCPCVSQAGAIGVTTTITIVILALLLLDRVEYHYLGELTPNKTAIFLLVIRILLIEGIIQLERLYLVPFNYASMLYLIPPYLATLYFGNRVGWWMTALAIVIYVGKETLYSIHWYHNQLSFLVCILFCFALVFLRTMGRVVFQEKASRMRAEQLLEEVARSHQQLSIYAEQVAELAALKERNRIARDIHDSLGHALTAITVQLEKALVYHEKHPQEAVQAVSAAKQVAREALREVRGSVRALRLTQDVFSCTSSMALLIQLLRTNRLTVNYHTEGDEADFSQDIRMTLYRVAQEGLTNIQKHAHAEKVQVTLLFGEQEASLRIHDDGHGFDPAFIQQKALEGKENYGLQGMQERITLVNGRLHLESYPGQGTTLQIVVPKASLVKQQEAHRGKDRHNDEF